MIKDLLTQIDRYCARNLSKKEERLEADRRRQHEAQHAAAQIDTSEEQGSFTAGGNQRNIVKPQVSLEEEDQEVDPSIVGSLDDVYPDEPGTEMESEEDPFKKVPAMDDHEKPSSLLDMERSMDAVIVYSDRGADQVSPIDGGADRNFPADDNDCTNLDSGSRTAAGLPDIIGNQGNTPPPDVTDQSSSHHPHPPPDLAVGAQRSVDLLDDTSAVEPVPSQPVDLTEGLDNS